MFASHGQWRYSIEPPVIYIEVIGSFNKEAVESFSNEMRVALSDFPEQPVHYAVVNLAAFELTTADSLAVAKAYFHGVKARGYLRVDYIEPTAIVQSMLESIWRGSDMEICFHKDLASYCVLHPHDQSVTRWSEKP